MIPVTKYGLTYYPASSWGMTGQLGPLMKPERPTFVVHHAESPDIACGATLAEEVRALKGIGQYQVEKFGRFSYQWLVFQSGNIYEAQGWGRVGAHVANNNSTCYGCCLVINGDRVLPTDAAVESVRAVMAAGLQGGFLAPDFQVKGHGDVLPGYNCPGKLLHPRVAELFGPAAPVQRPVLRRGSSGDAVRELQALLGMPTDQRTGTFGPLTATAVAGFQTRHGLKADGVVGSQTWAKLLAK